MPVKSSAYMDKIQRWANDWYRCPNCATEMRGLAGFSINLDKKGKPWVRCMECSCSANRREFLMGKKGKRDRPKREAKKLPKNVKHLRLKDGVTVTTNSAFTACPNCFALPSTDWSYEEYENWEDGTCPRCMHRRWGEGQAAVTTTNTSIITYESGTKTTYGSYDDYYTKKHGGQKTGVGQYTALTLCSHIRAPVVVAPDATVYAYSWRGSSSADLQGLDYFIALDSIWLGTGEILVSPGTSFRFKLERNSPRFIYLSTPDFSTPTNLQAMVELVEWVLHEARMGKQIGLGCMGGHGRTGALLAALTLASGMLGTGKDAVSYIRKVYCDEAVESWSQTVMLDSLAKHIWAPGGPTGDLDKVNEDVESAYTAQSAITMAAKIVRVPDARKPGIVRIMSSSYEKLKAREGEYASVEGWSGDGYDIHVKFKDGVTEMLFQREYEIIAFADEPLALTDGRGTEDAKDSEENP